MYNIELWVFWSATALYLLSFLITLLQRKRHRDMDAPLVLPLMYAAVSLHAAAIGIRALTTGRLPFIDVYESISVSCLLAWVILALLRPSSRLCVHAFSTAAGVLALLLIGVGSTLEPGNPLSANLRSVWLYIHATTATLSKSMFIIAAIGAAGRIRLIEHGQARNTRGALEESTLWRVFLAGFLFHSIMLVSGALWADAAWGRYWGWDPIEVGCLGVWIVVAAVFHVRGLPAVQSRVIALWCMLGASILAFFMLWVVGSIAPTIHTHG